MYIHSSFDRTFLSALRTIVLVVFSFTLVKCQKKPVQAQPQNRPVFDSVPTSHRLHPMVDEISGIADSRVNPGYLWGEEDSGNPPVIFLIGEDGRVKKHLVLKGCINTDWEDMVLSSGKIYIGDIGDNGLKRKQYYFYYFKEPVATADTIYNAKKITFKYPDGSHNAEAFLVDGKTKEIFIITKNDDPSGIYRLSPPYRPGTIQTAKRVGRLQYSMVVSAAQSPDGSEIILKTYPGLQYYKKSKDQSIAEALRGKYKNITYVLEPQGESICFAQDNSGFYTLSEKRFFNYVNLYFYKRM